MYLKKCPLKSAIIVPLKENEKLAVGLSQIISTQLEISKVSKLEELATKAEIKALQAQINPESARQLIVNLSTYLRYNREQISTYAKIIKR